MKRFVPSLLVLATVTILAMHSVEIKSQEISTLRSEVKELRKKVQSLREFIKT